MVFAKWRGQEVSQHWNVLRLYICNQTEEFIFRHFANTWNVSWHWLCWRLSWDSSQSCSGWTSEGKPTVSKYIQDYYRRIRHERKGAFRWVVRGGVWNLFNKAAAHDSLKLAVLFCIFNFCRQVLTSWFHEKMPVGNPTDSDWWRQVKLSIRTRRDNFVNRQLKKLSLLTWLLSPCAAEPTSANSALPKAALR